ncbi:MAG TPA: hypothetical protein VKT77_18130 [Chthonomonadaceae bacterium]|nr:hypothetical protein [Chthonomonadaceae bacterium]
MDNKTLRFGWLLLLPPLSLVLYGCPGGSGTAALGTAKTTPRYAGPVLLQQSTFDVLAGDSGPSIYHLGKTIAASSVTVGSGLALAYWPIGTGPAIAPVTLVPASASLNAPTFVAVNQHDQAVSSDGRVWTNLTSSSPSTIQLSSSFTLRSIDSAGVVSGSVGAPPQAGVPTIWLPGQTAPTFLKLPAGTASGFAVGSNASGIVIGSAFGEGTALDGFIWPSPSMAPVACVIPGTNIPATPEFINDAGTILAHYQSADGVDHNVVWSLNQPNPTPVDIGTISGTLDARAMNSSGQVVGDTGTFVDIGEGRDFGGVGTIHAFFWDPVSRKIQDLNYLIPPNSGWVLNAAVDINDDGVIRVSGTFNGVGAECLLLPLSGRSAGKPAYRLAPGPAARVPAAR